MAKPSPMMIIPPVLFVAIAGLFLGGLYFGDGDELPAAMASKEAPALPATPLLDLPTFTDADLRDGQVALVNFWASWCAPCRVEHPNLEAMAAQGIPIYGVNYKDDAANAGAFLAELGNPYAGILADSTGREALEWGVYGVPETYVIGGDGTILGRMAGPVVPSTVEQRLIPMLAEAGVTLAPLGGAE